MNRIPHIFGYCLLLCLGLTACNSLERGPCLEPKVSKLQLSCKRYDTASATYIDTALVNANVYCPEIDSAQFWYWGAKQQSQFELILSPLQDTLYWVLQADSALEIRDTLRFVYTTQLHFLSNACGFSHQYTLQKTFISHHQVDSMTILEPSVTNKAGLKHVEVYF